MRVRYWIVTAATLTLLFGAAMRWAKKDGRLGESYRSDVTQHGAFLNGWKAPARALRSVGCCLDDVTGATWDGAKLTLTGPTPSIALKLGDFASGPERHIPSGFDVLTAVHWEGRIWMRETQEQRLLEVDENDRIIEQDESGLRGVRGMILEPGSPAPTFLFTTAPRTQEACKADPKACPALIEWQDGGANTRLDCGESLREPSGIAISPDGETLFAADEENTDLVWLKMARVHAVGRGEARWMPKGEFARIALGASRRKLFRGLAVAWKPDDPAKWFLVGAGPDGLYFYSPDGHRLGTIETDTEISYLIPGHSSGPAPGVLYVVAGESIWALDMEEITEPTHQPKKIDVAQLRLLGRVD